MTAEEQARLKAAQDKYQRRTGRTLPRATPPPADKATMTALVEAGKRALAKKHHPDLANGSNEEMQKVNAAADALLKLITK